MEINSSVQVPDECLDDKKSDVKLKSNNEKTTSLFLYFAATVANLNYITFGVTVIWISPVAAKLSTYNSEENPLGRPVTTLELSLIGSLSQIGMLIGPILAEKIFDQFGRKRSINVLSVLIVACYVTLALSKHIYLYYGMIFCLGILLGGNMVGLSMYTSEITEDHNRGKFSCYTGTFSPIGNLYGFILGPFLSVKTFTLLCALPSVLLIIISEIFLPESPQYLINKGNREEALKALRKLLGSNHSRAEKVANEIECNSSKPNKINKSTFKLLFTNRSSRNGLFLCCILSSLTVCTGLPCIMSYLEPIFETAQTEISGSVSAMVIGALQIICYIASSVLVEKWGRRSLLLFSSTTIIIPLATLGVYFYLNEMGSSFTENIRWLPILGMTLLTISAIIGMCSVPSAYLNEVFMSDVKSTAISIVYFVSGILVAALVFLFPLMKETIGLAWCFWIFVVLSLFGFLFIYFRVPETKGKNILEIQEILGK